MAQKNLLRKIMSLQLILLSLKTQRPVIGVIYAPALNVLYFSEEKLGTYKRYSLLHLINLINLKL